MVIPRYGDCVVLKSLVESWKEKERKKMKYDLSGEDLGVLLGCLIGRRNNILGLIKVEGASEAYYAGYRQELSAVDSLLERFFPGSVERIKAAA